MDWHLAQLAAGLKIDGGLQNPPYWKLQNHQLRIKPALKEELNSESTSWHKDKHFEVVVEDGKHRVYIYKSSFC